MKTLCLLPLILCLFGCAVPATQSPARAQVALVPAPAGPVLAFDEFLPRVTRLSVGSAVAPVRAWYFDVTAYNEIEECEHSNEESWSGGLPCGLSWVKEDLSEIRGFRIYSSRRPGTKTNFVDVGSVLAFRWPPPPKPVDVQVFIEGGPVLTTIPSASLGARGAFRIAGSMLQTSSDLVNWVDLGPVTNVAAGPVRLGARAVEVQP